MYRGEPVNDESRAERGRPALAAPGPGALPSTPGDLLPSPGRWLVELLLLRRALHRGHGRLPAGRDLGDLVEVAHADEFLVPHGRVAVLLRSELATLQLRVGGHPLVFVRARQLEHAVIQRVERGQSDELELVVQRAQLLLEGGDLGLAQVLAPVE